jgi:hypothetical protein
MRSNMSPDHHRFWRMLNESARNQSDFRKRAETSLAYYDGDQWSDEHQKILEDRGQQATVINICRPVIDSLHSMYNERKTDMKVVGREIEDDELAGVLTHMREQLLF